LGAIDQSAFMTAVAGDDPAFQSTPIGFFAPGTPMASDVALDVLRGPRDMAKVKADLKAAGYNGEKVVLLVPTNSLAQKPLGDVAADMLQRAGMNVEYAGADFGIVLQRQLKKEPATEGGWSAAVANWQGIDWLNPVANTNLRGDGKAVGWYKSERMGALRKQWLASADLKEQQRICRDVQALSFEEIPYLPIGLYKQPTAYRSSITGILDGTAVFWNVRPA
jgi:peptide/nickel transport system substrate-binding protein